MQDDIIRNRLYTIIRDVLGISDIHFTPGSAFIKDLAIDSLNFFEMIVEVENEFQIVIPDEDAEKVITVGNLMDYISNHKMTSVKQ